MSLERQFGIVEPVPLIQTVEVRSHATAQVTVQQAAMRRMVLERTALELFERSFYEHRHLFPNWGEFVSILKKSITGGFLEKVMVYGKRNGDYVFSLELTIDWEQHRILANNTVFSKLDPHKSISAQVDEAIPQIVDFIKDKARSYKIEEVEPMFTYTDSDTKTLEERRRVTGTSAISGQTKTKIDLFEEASEGHSVVPGRLKEMKIVYRLSVK